MKAVCIMYVQFLTGLICGAVQFQQQKSNQLVRRDLQAHLREHAALLHNYTDHLRRHTHALLSLLLNK